MIRENTNYVILIIAYHTVVKMNEIYLHAAVGMLVNKTKYNFSTTPKGKGKRKWAIQHSGHLQGGGIGCNRRDVQG